MLEIDGVRVLTQVVGRGAEQRTELYVDGVLIGTVKGRYPEKNLPRIKRLVWEHVNEQPAKLCTACGLMEVAPRIAIARDCKRCQHEAAKALRAEGVVPPKWARNEGVW